MAPALNGRRRALGALAALAAGAEREASAPAVADEVEAFGFSRLPPGAPVAPPYRVFSLSGRVPRTEYRFVAEGGRTVLEAEARGSTAALVRELRVDPARRPRLDWRWQALALVQRGGLGRRETDDFALRLYVSFDLPLARLPALERTRVRLARAIWGPEVPAAALCYVWDASAPVGTVVPNAYTDRVRMIVVDSGEALLGRWREHQRDVAADWRLAFGAGAGAVPPVNALIASTDTDNTGETVLARYGDAAFRAAEA